MARGRPRHSHNHWLPPHVQQDKWGYTYHNRTTREYVRLCGPGASQADVWAAYEAMRQDTGDTVAELVKLYFDSPQFKTLRPATQGDYRQWSAAILRVFGEMPPDSITSPHVQLFMDARGEKYPTAANHEKSFLSLLLTWGKARGYVGIANPCTPVRSIRTAPGGRYVDDHDYLAFLDFLIAQGHPMHAAAMEIAYLCGSRQQDVLRLLRHRPAKPRPDDCYVTEEGLHIWQAKTGKVQVKLWSPRLREAVALATSQKRKVETLYVIRSRTGARFTRSGFNTSWIRMQKEAETKGLISARFRFHDLKVKAISDAEGDKQLWSGHKTRSMSERYNRTPDRVQALRGPQKE